MTASDRLDLGVSAQGLLRKQKLDLHGPERYDLNKWCYFAICLGLMATALIASITSTFTECRTLELGISFVLGACTALTASIWAMRCRKYSDHSVLAASLSNRAPEENLRYLG